MPDYGDPGGGYPPFQYDATPDLASLQYPWSDPPVPPSGDLVPLAPPPDASLAGNPYAPPPLEPDILPPPPPPATVAAMPDITIRPEQTLDAPDALTGAAPRAGTPEAAQFGNAEQRITPEQHYQQTARQYSGDPLAIPDDVERKRALDSLDPYQLAEVNARDKERRDAFIVQRRREYAEADAEAARQHIAALQTAYAATQAKIDQTIADAQRIADTKIDPTGGVTGARRLAGIAAGFIGGLVQSRTGSARNAGLDAYSEAINAGIEAQKAELANKRGAIDLKRNTLAAEFARHGDMFQAEEAVRLASWRHVDDTLAFEQQSYDPRGRTALLIANQRRQIGAAMAQAQDAARQKFLENNLKVQDAARQQQLADETLRHNRASEGIDYARLSIERGKAKAEQTTWSPEQLAILNPGLPQPAIPMTQADYTKWLGTQKQGEEYKKAARENDPEQLAAKDIKERSMGGEITPIKNDKGEVVGGKSGPIMMADGKTIWVPKGTEASVTALQKKHSAAAALVQTLDKIREIGPEWLSNTANTDKLQRLQQLAGDAVLQAIAAKDLGVPTGHDIELAQNFLGTTDPTRRKDSIAGLMQSRESIVRDHNVELATHGLDKPWDPPDLGRKGAVAQPDDDRLRALLVNPARDPSGKDLVQKELAANPGYDRAADPDGDKLWHAAQDWRNQHGNVLPSQVSALEALVADAASPDPKVGAKAFAALDTAANRGTVPMRALARQALTNAIARSSESVPAAPEEVTTRSSSVARDAISEPRPPDLGPLLFDSAGNPR